MRKVLSLGAGVQSTCIALMATKGVIEKPDYAVFADTQAEPGSVMAHLWWLASQIDFPLYVVTAGSLDEASRRVRVNGKTGKRVVASLIPAYTLSPTGSRGLMGRKCTTDYKITPIQRFVKQKEGINRPGKLKQPVVEQWIGISADEAQRMKPSRDKWVKHRWPLIDLRMTRGDCLKWIAANGYPEPPRSACYFCPFHGDAEWIRMKTETPEEFTKAVEYEQKLNESYKQDECFRADAVFLHNSMVPLDKAVFGKAKDHLQVDLFGNECEGLCGV